MDSNNVVSREMRLKILYTFDADNAITCLTRSSGSVAVRMIPEQDIGVIGLVACARAITSASPEILASSESFDYAVYSTDYAEPDMPFVGHGMLSWILSSHTQEERARFDNTVSFDENSISSLFVVGRVCTNVLSIFSRDASPTLEVRLRLKPVTSSSQADYIRSIKLYREISAIISETSTVTRGSFDHVSWAEFLSSNSNINSLIKQQKMLDQQQRLQQIQSTQARRRRSSNTNMVNPSISLNTINQSHSSSNLNNSSPWTYNNNRSGSSPPPSSPPTFSNDPLSYTPSALSQSTSVNNFLSPNKPFLAQSINGDASTSPTEVSPTITRSTIARPTPISTFQPKMNSGPSQPTASRPSIKEYIQLLDKQKSLSEKARLVPDHLASKLGKGRFEKSKRSPANNTSASTPESPDSEDKKKTPRASEPSLKRKDNITKDLYEDILAGRPPKFCENCGAIHTPAWRKANHKVFYEGDSTLKTLSSEELNNLRRDTEGRTYYLKQFILCNSCGIYYKDKGHMRPESLWDVKKNASDLTKVVEKIQNLKQFQASDGEFSTLAKKSRSHLTSASSPILAKSHIMNGNVASLKRNSPREFGEVQSSPIKRMNSLPTQSMSNKLRCGSATGGNFSSSMSFTTNHEPSQQQPHPIHFNTSPTNSSTPLDDFTPFASTVASSPPTSVILDHDDGNDDYKENILPQVSCPGTPPRAVSDHQSIEYLFTTPRNKNANANATNNNRANLFLTPQNETSPMKWLSRALNGSGVSNKDGLFHSDPSFHSPSDFETFMNETFSSPTKRSYRNVYSPLNCVDQLNPIPISFNDVASTSNGNNDNNNNNNNNNTIDVHDDSRSAILAHPTAFYQKVKSAGHEWNEMTSSSSQHELVGDSNKCAVTNHNDNKSRSSSFSKSSSVVASGQSQSLMVDFREFLS